MRGSAVVAEEPAARRALGSPPFVVLETRRRVLTALATGGRQDFGTLVWSALGRRVAALAE